MFLQCFVVFVEPIVLECMSVPFQGHARRALQIAPLDIQSQRAKPSAVSPDLSPGTVSGMFFRNIFLLFSCCSLSVLHSLLTQSGPVPHRSSALRDGSHRLQILLIHPSTPSTVL